jgi:hypothetical protein
VNVNANVNATMRVMGVIGETHYTRGMELLEAIVAMLTKMT